MKSSHKRSAINYYVVLLHKLKILNIFASQHKQKRYIKDCKLKFLLYSIISFFPIANDSIIKFTKQIPYTKLSIYTNSMSIQLSTGTTLPIYQSIPQNTSIVLSHSEKFLQTIVADGIFISDEIEQFLNDCDQILALLAKVQSSGNQQETLTKKSNTLTKCIIKRVQTAKALGSEILNQDQKQEKSSEKNIKWITMDRPLLSKQLCEYVQTDAAAILQRINDLHFQYQLNEASKKHDIAPLREFMTTASYLLWATNLGSDTIEGSWKQFINSYQALYGSLDLSMLQFMEKLLCNNEHKVTIDRLILALRKYGNQFPFPKDIVQSIHQNASNTEKSVPEEKRMQLTKIALELVEKFSEAKMRDHLVTIYTWYRGCDTKNKKQMRERADEWGLLIKERRSFIDENKRELLQEKHKVAERIDQARRAIFFFYEQFMVMWRTGDATREILEEIDFPGKGRIRDFLNFVAPLDQANYYVVMGIDKDVPIKDYRPKLYDFMDTYLSMLVQKSKERDEYAKQ